MAQSGSTDISELLRRSKVVAVKLRLADFESWVEHELNGYPPEAEVPAYRKIGTNLMMKNPYHGLQPVTFTKANELTEHFASVQMRESVAKVAHLVAEGEDGIQCGVSPSELEVLLKISADFRLCPVVRVVNTTGVIGILDAVRNRILDWSLALERQGVFGEGMTFSLQEKQAAANVTINNYGTVETLVGKADHSAVRQGDDRSVGTTYATAVDSPNAVVTAASGGSAVHQRIEIAIAQQRDKKLGAALQEIAKAIGSTQQLDAAQKLESQEILAFMAEQCTQAVEMRQPATVLKAVAVKFRSLLGLAADVLQVWTSVGPAVHGALKLSGV